VPVLTITLAPQVWLPFGRRLNGHASQFANQDLSGDPKINGQRYREKPRKVARPVLLRSFPLEDSMSPTDAQFVGVRTDWLHLVDALPTPVFVKNREQKLIAASASFCKLVDCARESILGFQDFEIRPGDYLFDSNAEVRTLETGEQFAYEVGLPSDEAASEQAAKPLKIRLGRWVDPDGNKVLVGSVEDLTELAEANVSLKVAQRQSQLAFTFDTLTGLLNRSQIKPCIDECIATSEQSGLSFVVLLISLNRFKAVNNVLGNQAGDRLLQVCAQRIHQVVRARTAVARSGGDEYVVLLSETDPLSAGRTAERIIEMIGMPIDLDGSRLEISSSVGIAMYPRDGRSSNELLIKADQALTEGKRKKPSGCVNYFEPSIGRDVERKLALSRDLAQAVDNDQIQTYLQPIVRHESGQIRVIGYESLARWQRGSGEWVSPLEFVPLLEESGLIIEAGEKILNRACGFIATRLSDDVYVSVNVSGQQIAEEGFLDMVDRAVQTSGIPYQRLALEVTETLAMNDHSTCIELLNQLTERGIRLMIDDFGTGYSNLARLSELPFSVVKIDRSLIRDLPGKRADSAILRTVISMARELELRLVVEGIEEPAQRDYLIELGVNTFQGYLFGKPKPMPT
jgi:diguanylate cyclase (GGDEF)-like protein